MGVDPFHAVLTLLFYLGVAHIELGGLDILHRAGDLLFIGLLGGVLHRQEGHRLLDDQLLAHPDFIHQHIGIKDGQLVGPHVQGVGDSVEGVALLHLVGGLLHPQLAQGGANGLHIILGVGRQLDGVDLHILHKIIADGVLGEVRLGHLVQQLVQRVLGGGVAQLLAVHPHSVGGDQRAHAIEQGVLNLCGVAELVG